MPQIAATILTVTKACRMIREMSSQDLPWSEDDRSYGRNALEDILEKKMDSSIDCYLADPSRRGGEDGRNCSYGNHFTEFGDIELGIRRTRHFSAVKVVRTYARRAAHIDHLQGPLVVEVYSPHQLYCEKVQEARRRTRLWVYPPIDQVSKETCMPYSLTRTLIFS